MRTYSFIAVIIIIISGFTTFYWKSEKKKLQYYVESKYGPVWVFDKNNTRCMSFRQPDKSDIVQSCILLDNYNHVVFSYIKMFISTLFLQPDPRKILIIGLGGSSAAKAFNVLTPNAKIHTVEINPDLAPLVEKYFFYKFNDTNRLFIEDGVEYVKKSPSNRYDIILIDAFDDEIIPEGFLTHEFINNIKRILTKDGVVAMNSFSADSASLVIKEFFRDTFGEYYNLQSSGSSVFIAKQNGNLPDFHNIVEYSRIWVYRMAELGINTNVILPLYKDSLDK